MIRQGNYLYAWCPTGEWLVCGEVKEDWDGEYVEWFA